MKDFNLTIGNAKLHGYQEFIIKEIDGSFYIFDELETEDFHDNVALYDTNIESVVEFIKTVKESKLRELIVKELQVDMIFDDKTEYYRPSPEMKIPLEHHLITISYLFDYEMFDIKVIPRGGLHSEERCEIIIKSLDLALMELFSYVDISEFDGATYRVMKTIIVNEGKI